MKVLRTPDECFEGLADYAFQPNYTTIEDAGGTEIRIDSVQRIGPAEPFSRRVGEEVEQAGFATGGSGQQEAAASQGGEHRLDHAGGELGSDGRVESVAACLENLNGRVRGHRVTTGDGACRGHR